MLILFLAVALMGAPKTDAKLVGTWLAGGEPFLTLKANGTGQMDDGKITWTTADGKLTVIDDEGTADIAGYRVDGDDLTLTMGGIPIPLTRAGAGVQVKKQAKAGNDQLSQLLLSSAWCSSNKIPGATRVVFRRDGSWSSASNGGRWAVRNDQLLMSHGENPQLTRVPGFSVSQSSGGHPIIHSMGKEYARCD